MSCLSSPDFEFPPPPPSIAETNLENVFICPRSLAPPGKKRAVPRKAGSPCKSKKGLNTNAFASSPLRSSQRNNLKRRPSFVTAKPGTLSFTVAAMTAATATNSSASASSMRLTSARAESVKKSSKSRPISPRKKSGKVSVSAVESRGGGGNRGNNVRDLPGCSLDLNQHQSAQEARRSSPRPRNSFPVSLRTEAGKGEEEEKEETRAEKNCCEREKVGKMEHDDPISRASTLTASPLLLHIIQLVSQNDPFSTFNVPESTSIARSMFVSKRRLRMSKARFVAQPLFK